METRQHCLLVISQQVCLTTARAAAKNRDADKAVFRRRVLPSSSQLRYLLPYRQTEIHTISELVQMSLVNHSYLTD